MLKLLFLACTVTLLQPSAVESCTEDSLLGSLNSLLQESIITLGGQQGGTVDLVINGRQIVCLTTGTMRGTYSSASVVVDFTCSGTACSTSGSKFLA